LSDLIEKVKSTPTAPFFYYPLVKGRVTFIKLNLPKNANNALSFRVESQQFVDKTLFYSDASPVEETQSVGIGIFSFNRTMDSLKLPDKCTVYAQLGHF